MKPEVARDYVWNHDAEIVPVVVDDEPECGVKFPDGFTTASAQEAQEHVLPEVPEGWTAKAK